MLHGSAPPIRPTETIARRTCIAACAFVVLLFAASIVVSVTGTALGGRHELMLSGGRLHYEYDKTPRGGRRALMTRSRDRVDLRPDWHVYPGSWFVRLPLWIPFMAFALPGAWLWRRERTRRRLRPMGCCEGCGYSLAGLGAAGAEATVVCPECGRQQRLGVRR